MIRNRAANWFPFVMLLLAIAAVAYASEDEKTSPGSRIPVEFIDVDGNPTGSAVLTETVNGVLVDANLRGLEIGWHGFHIHERAQCKTPDFKSAGGHFAPKDSEHGFLVAKGPHAGDMPNVFVGKDGTARVQHLLEDVSLHEGKNALLDKDGSAIVVHSGADDYRSQPSGDAGSRLACAEIGDQMK